jgi:argininosuccinate lyase
MMTLMLESAQFRKERMREALRADFSNATDLADYLVTQGIPFRQCHEISGRAVRHCIEKGIGLEDLTAADLKAFHPALGDQAMTLLKHDSVMQARRSPGGTAPDAVRSQIAKAKEAQRQS